MSTSLLAAVFATLAAAAFSGMLLLRCTRMPRADLVAWIVAEVGLTVALAAQALGYSQGFTPLTFRVVQVGAQLIVPLALVWGLVEVTARNPAARFGARLALGAATVIGGVVMSTDPLGSTSFSTNWPPASTYYQVLPSAALELTAVVTILSAIVAAVLAGVRSRRDPDGRELLVPVLAAAGAVLLTEGLRVALPVRTGYPVLCLLVAALTWFAGSRAARVPLEAYHAESAQRRGSGWDDYDPYGDDTGFGRLYGSRNGRSARHGGGSGFADDYEADTGFEDAYASDTGFEDAYPSDTGYGLYRADTDGFGLDGPDAGYGPAAGPGTGFGPGGPYEPNGVGRGGAGQNGAGRHGAGDGVIETGDMLAAVDGPVPAGFGTGGPVDTARLYGQIAIYTLLDGRAEEFDHLARQVMEEVRAQEPDTLVYILHDVPSAPMQRILYEVYRDDVAFADHARQPYIRRFEEDRKPYVLATNVIELGVHHAKVLPFGDLPGPSGGRDAARHRGNGSR